MVKAASTAEETQFSLSLSLFLFISMCAIGGVDRFYPLCIYIYIYMWCSFFPSSPFVSHGHSTTPLHEEVHTQQARVRKLVAPILVPHQIPMPFAVYYITRNCSEFREVLATFGANHRQYPWDGTPHGQLKRSWKSYVLCSNCPWREHISRDCRWIFFK